jgi:hypothetical protein
VIARNGIVVTVRTVVPTIGHKERMLTVEHSNVVARKIVSEGSATMQKESPLLLSRTRRSSRSAK